MNERTNERTNEWKLYYRVKVDLAEGKKRSTNKGHFE